MLKVNPRLKSKISLSCCQDDILLAKANFVINRCWNFKRIFHNNTGEAGTFEASELPLSAKQIIRLYKNLLTLMTISNKRGDKAWKTKNDEDRNAVCVYTLFRY